MPVYTWGLKYTERERERKGERVQNRYGGTSGVPQHVAERKKVEVEKQHKTMKEG